MMEGPAFLPLPQGLRITEVHQEEAELTVEVLSERTSACCPLCEQSSYAVHSRYQRRLKDVPCGGQAVRLHLTVHKFFCRNPRCRRKIFTERVPTVTDRVSVQKAIWLLARPYEKLKAEERSDLQEICQASQELAALHPLAQSFGQIVRKREGHRLQDWIKQVETSSFRDVKRFTAGLQRDQEEVLAGLTLVYSNGQVEGQINKLKLKDKGMAGQTFPCSINECSILCKELLSPVSLFCLTVER